MPYFEEEKQQTSYVILPSMNISVSEKIKQPIICSLTFVTLSQMLDISNNQLDYYLLRSVE
jgi:hypothetical protein